MTARLRLALALSLGVLGAGACRRDAAPKSAWLVVTARPGDALDLAHARAEGARVLHATASGPRLVVELDPVRGGRITVSVDGACQVRVAASEIRAGETIARALEPYLDLGRSRAQIGFDTPFSLTVRAGCPEAREGTIAWQRVAGAELRDLHTADSGFVLSARTETLAEALGGPPPAGLVPLSPRTRGETELEATWSAPGSPSITRRVLVSAAARSRGLPNIVVGTRVWLGGGGWHVVGAPGESRAVVTDHGGAGTLEPDVRGAFTLEDGAGHGLRLVAGKYDETPLDCGRSSCHADVARAARSSPMATVLQRGLDTPFSGDYPTCAIGCHAVGEPGQDDGGFVAVAHSLGRSLPDLARGGFHDLPAPLRRLSGVGCLGCHGPGAIPEPSGRSLLLRVDVCATCHDAPPRYGHVAAWRSCGMARADADPRTREDARCARCHTTWGALGKPEWRSPANAEPTGIACAACHAVHPASQGSPALGETCAAALARDVLVPALLEGALPPQAKKSHVCLGCHTPSPDDASPSGTAAALFAARGGLDPKTGAKLEGTAPHAAIEGGCIGCHHDGPKGLARGSAHAFQAARDACTACHAPKSDPSLRARAEALWARISGIAPPGHGHIDASAVDRKTLRGRAAWDVALVLEDPAADAHNAPYARVLLDAAERALGGSRP